ncbi:squamosa promoter-binding-like protein 1 [Zingiber officinale]|uniref:squamosa promoter-binding-like protein 1 n=1 Tax=Zingiber officinale TaxID=94328 RepID=UPI001C4C07E2|nr:squamosa promoter-binding-like protein 1 [Zingiber officinale]XP_042437120.1 squamosa promoter-binding-like protein 1 [Zingiber officinale]XP_042437127.1 squamosa promoter-binding-like protein 1 [Zingiber officinale]
MEASLGSEGNHFLAAGTSNLSRIGKKSLEWNLNDWRWDGELFVANPTNAAPSDCENNHQCHDQANGSNSSSSSEFTDFGLLVNEKSEAEKRKRIQVVEDGEPCFGAEALSLKLGTYTYPMLEGMESNLKNTEGEKGKKSKTQGENSNYPTCQVEACDTDLSKTKDYHRRHKVCEMHAKASSAIVRNAIQRFCQQCSRFHLLEEFDEGKRSCRRRLAGHNKRRRKRQPDAIATANPSTDEQTSGYLLISLLRILSNLQSDNQNVELLAHLLGSLAKLAKSFDPSSLSQLLQSSQVPQKFEMGAGTSSKAVNTSALNIVSVHEYVSHLNSVANVTCTAIAENHLKETDHIPSVVTANSTHSNGRVAFVEPVLDKVRIVDFDLNDTYVDTQKCEEGRQKLATVPHTMMVSSDCPSWLVQDHQSSPLQNSRNSDSTSNQSQSSFNGDAQFRTDRIIFKLFGKDPNDLPLVLRAQILDWLSNSPTDMESYIRPGCLILTIYLRQSESAWVQLCNDLSTNLNKLLHNSSDKIWRMGWIFSMIQNYAVFIYNGQVVLDLPLHIRQPNNHCKILSVTPIAVPQSSRVQFTVKCFNVDQPTSRLLCSFDGKYLLQERIQALAKETDRVAENDLSQCLSFSCLLPDVTGRGFIELEDCGVSDEFLPFIVAEDDVCSEICMLENEINIVYSDGQLPEQLDEEKARNQALEFINELGWLLRRNHYLSICCESKIPANLFTLARFQWLMSFAMDREWPAVVKKLLNIFFNGSVNANGKSPIELILDEYLLHTAVQRKSKTLVEALLRYASNNTSEGTYPDQLLFRPDMLGPSGITPLHIVASSDDAESILDALTNDPGQVGIKAWNNVRDNTGFTPEDYAISRGHHSYLTLVQKKIDKQLQLSQVILNISGDASYKLENTLKPSKPSSYEMSTNWSNTKQPPYCNRCSRQVVYQNSAARTMLHRPLMLALVGIAAVCVCVGLLFKTPPEVFYVFPSFRWELLDYGYI